MPIELRGRLCVVAVVWALGCGGERSAGERDAGSVDSGIADAGSADPDAGLESDAGADRDAAVPPLEVTCARAFRSDAHDIPTDVAVASPDGSYFAGVGGPPGGGSEARGAFLGRLDGCDEPGFMHHFVGAFGDSPPAIAAATGGDVVVAGAFRQTIDLGTGPMTAAEEISSYLARFGPDGSVRWVAAFHPMDGEALLPTLIFHDVAVAGDASDIWVVGTISGRFAFEGGAELAFTSFLARFDSAGRHVASMPVPGSPRRLATLDDTGLRIVGTFDESVDFGGGTITPTEGTDDAFVLALRADGSFEWALAIGDAGTERPSSVAVSSTGSTYLGLDYHQTSGLPGGVEASEWAHALVQITPDGEIAWWRNAGGYLATERRTLFATTDDGVLVGGVVDEDAAIVGETPLPIASRPNAFVASFDAAGTLARLTHIPSRNAVRAHHAVIDADGSTVFALSFAHTLDLGELHFETAGSWDTVFVRMP